MVVGDQDAHASGSLDEVTAHAVPRSGDDPGDGSRARALVVASAPGVRAGIRALLDANAFVVTAEAADGPGAVAVAGRARPDICIVHGGSGGGVATLALLKARLPSAAVVLLVQRADADELIDALRAGASGYILESGGAGGIGRALQAVQRGESAIPRELLGALADEFRARGLRRRVQLPGRPAVELTRRQSEVLELLRRGLSTGEIADRLRISRVTVRRHLGLAIGKLDAKDRAAALRAIEQAEARS